jgi:hypothetical protein
LKVTVEIYNWEKFNPRADVKVSTWFRVEHTIATSQTLFGLEAAERWVWIALLAMASQRSISTFEFNLDYFVWSAGVDGDTVLSALEKLEQNGALAFQPDADADVRARTCTNVDVRARDLTSRDVPTNERTTNVRVRT